MEIIESANGHGIRMRTENRTTLVKLLLLKLKLKEYNNKLKFSHILTFQSFCHFDKT